MGDALPSPVETVMEGATVAGVFVMLHRRLERLTVVRGGRPPGTVSRQDLLDPVADPLRGPSPGAS